ncbi:hypothetical protein TNCT_214971 [Trichonephila clavata]|uniref:Uncharacterized protein n=1 Tax=Trichonephila clavata TaxID=2740835 RepID=A0A8X6FT01_TRICU|nr:hypothetical protein TNCT_214971 [Trichonephila clavata]
MEWGEKEIAYDVKLSLMFVNKLYLMLSDLPSSRLRIPAASSDPIPEFPVLTTIPIENLFSNIGGLMGCWLGARECDMYRKSNQIRGQNSVQKGILKSLPLRKKILDEITASPVRNGIFELEPEGCKPY